MSKVLTFSRTFPSYHPRKGEPTYFVEKLTKSRILAGGRPVDIPQEIFLEPMYFVVEPKHHTIRAGNRWKVGDKFSPRVWGGKPYQSKQIIIAPDLEVKKVWPIEVKNGQFIIGVSKDKELRCQTDSFVLKNLAANDGLALPELLQWFKFPKDFKGQIICWNDSVNY